MGRLLILATDGSRTERMREVVSLDEVAHAAVEDLPPAQAQRVSVSSTDDLLTVNGDFQLLKTLTANALDNALKFSGEKPVKLSIRDDAAHVYLRIEDEGVGIPESDRARVFDAFYRSASARASNVAGYGLGLTLIAHVAGTHGGTARFLPARQGCTLEIALPKNVRSRN